MINKNMNNKIELIGDEVWDVGVNDEGVGGFRVILNNGVEIIVYENGVLDFYDFERHCESEDAILNSDDERYEESMNYFIVNYKNKINELFENDAMRYVNDDF